MNRVLLVGNYATSIISFRAPLIRALIERGYDVIAAAPQATPEVDCEVASKVQALGARYRSFFLRASSLNPLHELRAVWSLARLIRGTTPDILITYTVKPILYGTLASLVRPGMKRYALITGLGYTFIGSSRLSRTLSKLSRLAFRAALSRCRRIAFWNGDDRDLFVREGLVAAERSVLAAGSGVDTEEYVPRPYPSGPPTFLMLSRILVDKGVREFAGAARAVLRDAPEARFQLAGDFVDHPNGITRDELEGWQKDGILSYLGKHSDVRPLIGQSSVVVLPSYREGTPRSLLEAMAMARPIITTDVPGCRQVVRHGISGFKIPVRDGESLAAACREFIRDPALVERMGRAGRDIAEREFDAAAVASKLVVDLGL